MLLTDDVSTGAVLAASRFPLLRRLSITSLVAMIATSALLILLYRQDQLDEHEKIAAQENEKTAIHIIHQLDNQLDAFLAATEGLDAPALRANPNVNLLATTLSTFREHRVLKLKIFSLSGIAVFSSTTEEIGLASMRPAFLEAALRGETRHVVELRDTFISQAEVIHDRYIAETFMPLTHAGKNIGAIEIYADATPIMDRIRIKTTQIALLVFGIFAALYAALFFSARRADRALLKWQEALADNTRRTAESEARLSMTINSALDGVVSIDATGRLIDFNPAAEEIFGWRKEEVIGREMTEVLIPERYRNQHQSGLARYMQTGETHILNRRIEIMALRRNGMEFPVELTVTPIREGDRTIFTAYIRDISKRKQAEEELRESRAFHQSVTEAMGEIGIGLFIVNADYHVQFMNAVMKKWFGDQTGRTCYLSVGGATERCAHCCLEQVLKENKTVHYTPTTSDGRTFDIIATPIQNKDGTISKLEVVRDVTDHRWAEQELRIAAKAFESHEGMLITDADGVIQRVNRAFTEMTGYSAGDVVGQKPSILKSGRHDDAFYQTIYETLKRDGHWQGEIWSRRKSGEVYPGWQTITAVADVEGRVTHYVSAFSDISRHKEAEEKIRILAFYDPLTQLSNRRHLLDRLQQALALSIRTGKQGALLFLDLDNFKSINDAHGHAVGDLLLMEAAKRLQACVREGDTTARLGGDEFVILLENLDADELLAAAQAETVGEKIRVAIGLPYHINGLGHHSTASIGITLFRGPVKTTDEMLRRADVALYQAKDAGRNTMRFFDPAMQAMIAARAALESSLRHAVCHQEQFVLYYQPQVDSSGRTVGAEALVRWQHPERGMVSPTEFIPLAEETGLILPLGHWVMSTACRQLADWAAQPEMAHLTIAVNVSARQFSLPNFVEEVLALVEHFGIDPGKLKLEITEGMLLDNMEDIIVKMTALNARNINFSLDDFGTGYSSLSYLKRLPLYQLKIDKSFVRDVFTDSNDAAIAKTIILLAKSLGLGVIAEGVETEAQRTLLELNDCHVFQGYLFSKPVPVNEFESLVLQSTRLNH